MGKISYVVVGLLLFSTLLFAEIPEYQRLGVDEYKANVITVGFNISDYYYDLYGIKTHYFYPSFIIQYRLMNKYYVQTSVPFLGRIKQTDNPGNVFDFSYSDPELNVGVMHQIGDIRVRTEFSYSYPLGIWNSYQAGSEGIIGGSGYHNLGLTVSLSKIFDPVVCNSSLSYTVALPRIERFGWSMNPGVITYTLNFSEVLNDVFGLSVEMKNTVALPSIYSGTIKWQDTQYILNVSLAVLIHIENADFKIFVSKDLSKVLGSFLIGLESYYDFSF